MRDVPGAAAAPVPGGAALGRAATTGARQQGLSQAARFVLQLGATIVLARLILPRDFGLVAVALALSQIVAATVVGPVTRGVVSLRLSEPRTVDTAWSVVAGATAGVAVAGTLIALALPVSGEAVLALGGTLAALPLQATSELQVARLQDEHDFRTIARARLAATVASIAVAIALALVGFGLVALVARVWVSPLTVTVLGVSRTRWVPRPRVDPEALRVLATFGRPLSVANLLSITRRRADDLLVGLVLGPTPLGLYNVAYRFLEVPVQQVNELTSTVMLPTLTALGERRSIVPAFRRSQTLLLWLVAPVGIVSLVAGDVLVPAVLGQEWTGAGPVVQVFGVVTVLQVAGTNVGTLFLSANATPLAMRVALWTTPVVLVGFVAGLPWGIMGVSIGYLVATLLVAYPSYRYAARAVGTTARQLSVGLWPLLGTASLVTLAAVAARLHWGAGTTRTLVLAGASAVGFWLVAAGAQPTLVADLRRVVRDR